MVVGRDFNIIANSSECSPFNETHAIKSDIRDFVEVRNHLFVYASSYMIMFLQALSSPSPISTKMALLSENWIEF